MKLFILAVTLFISLSPLAEQSSNDDKLMQWAKFFSPSTLTEQQRIDELKWFKEVSRSFRGKKITSVAEDIKTHYWERDVLTKAFEDITGIKVVHDIIGEGSVVERMQQQLSTGNHLYDIYVNDADHIGTHLRTKSVLNLTKYMAGEGVPYTNPYLDLDDFLNLEFAQDYDGNQLQLPDQQFANLYWFRHDWFSRKDIQQKFRAYTVKKYGKNNAYDLGVPVNFAAYEDIAEFFTQTPIDGKKVYGHMDFGKKSPSLGWRFTDAWLSIAGAGDKGLPNGLPVDEWGIRSQNRIPVGSSTSRGGATNGPAAVYALDTYLNWLDRYTPPDARAGTFIDIETVPARGDIAQQIFLYTLWLGRDEYRQPGSPVVGKDGNPLWRVAPTPHGRYWDPGMKEGYQDAGSWTIPLDTRGLRRHAAWLWAQFCVSRTVSLKKFVVGGTPIRKSDVHSDYLKKHSKEWGGLVEFYASKEQLNWTGSGRNLPHYPIMSLVWWPNLDKAITGEFSPQQAMDTIAREQDRLMSKMKLSKYSPRLNKEEPVDVWLKRPGAPKAPRSRPKPETMPYEQIIKRWRSQ